MASTVRSLLVDPRRDAALWPARTEDGGPLGRRSDPRLPKVGHAFIQKARKLGIKTICAHKGFGGGSRYASPSDVPRAAKEFPDVDFIVYHSGFERTGPREGPYTGATAHVGINRLIAAMKRHGIRPNQNVYAELGSTWWTIMRDPTQAAHVLGKLLRHG
jgi:uncharacterized protein